MQKAYEYYGVVIENKSDTIISNSDAICFFAAL